MTAQNFSWVETHKQLVDFLKTKENDQLGLIGLLKSVGISPFNDKTGPDAHDTELEEIDPFTFFCYIYKYGSEKRLSLLQAIAEKLNLSVPQDEKGIPSAQAQKVWLFPYKLERTNNEIERLWSFFHKVIADDVSDADFEDILQIKGTGKTKVTEALFYINPEKYLPINGPTKPYIKLVLGIEPKFNSFRAYQALLEKVKEKTNLPFYELSYEAWKWNKDGQSPNYWIFQGNPKVFDFKTALREEILSDWTVSAHKDKIKAGDKVILWITGKSAGCYALAEVTSKPHQKSESADKHLWKTDDKSALKVDIEITHNWVDEPILKEDIDDEPGLKELKVGNQGTNFSATEDEYETLLAMKKNNTSNVKYWLYAPGENASKWDEFYEEGIMGLGWESLGDLAQYKTKEEIAKRLREVEKTKSSKKNDANANYDFYQGISIGDVIIAKKGRSEYLGYGIVTSDYIFDTQRDDFKKIRKVVWKKRGHWDEPDKDIVLKTLTDITKYPKYVKKLVEMIGIGENQETKNHLNQPLNQILYGPPGTGKTYTLKTKYFERYTTKETSLTKAQYFEEVVRGLTWWQVVTLALLEKNNQKVSELVDNHWVAHKSKISESKNVRATLWGTLQMHTIQESNTVAYTQRLAPLIFDKNKDKTWQIIEDELKEQAPEIFDILEDYQNFKPNPDNIIKRYVFTTFHQSFSYEDFIEGIKPMISEMESSDVVQYVIEDGVFKELCRRAESDPGNRYAIFIDEINRGNVSAIFGELITLIETDKRKGMDNGMSATLPYSKKPFSVPPNVDIYGTMNTADRSVEALDTALRRRFSFVEMMPRPELLRQINPHQGVIEDIDLVEVLQTMNDRIEVLVDRDHTIGHSYFMKVNSAEDLKNVFKDKVIPLLQEYFFGDYGKMEMVIGSYFFAEKTTPVTFAVQNHNYHDLPKRYLLKDLAAEDFDIVQAMHALLGKTETP
jgi:hypothetical protein